MAIDFTRLFTTTGKIIGGLNLINAHRGASLATRIDTIDNRYETFGQDIAVGLYEALEANRDDNDGLVTYLQDLMEDTLIAEVKADRPLIQETKEAALSWTGRCGCPSSRWRTPRRPRSSPPPWSTGTPS
jgi:hypothetical protein